MSSRVQATANRPPLHLYLLAHPQSSEANKIAFSLMRRFVEPPASGGLRIPVFFTPDKGDHLPPELDTEEGLNIDAAGHTLIIVLADKRMLRTVPNGTGDAWISFAQRALDLTPLDSSPHHVLPVALDQEGFRISEDRHILSAMLNPDLDIKNASEQRLANISFHIAARATQLLVRGKVPMIAPDRMKAPVTIFLSHAKVDLSDGKQDPVRQTRRVLDELPVEQWFDAQQIATTQAFASAIEGGIRDSTIMLAFQTDQYSSRSWCRREVLEAKRMGVHILVVDALESGETRSFPYCGNVPTVRWGAGDSEVAARRVIDRAVLEALRFSYNRVMLERLAEPGEVVLAGPPEAITLANEHSDFQSEKIFLYPDPPLGREELQVLQQLRPNAQFLTPLTKVARFFQNRQSSKVSIIAVSISESDDVRKYGLSQNHFNTLTDEIHLYLLLAGLKIAYGGALKGDLAETSNFTLRLFELVRTYSKLAEGVQAQPLSDAIINVAPWPLWLTYGDSEWDLFNEGGGGNVAKYLPAQHPSLPWSDNEIFPLVEDERMLGLETAQARYAWAEGLTLMRREITALSHARLVIGGKLSGFSGIVPGVVEEAWLSLTQKQPLFLVGGFGGATRAVSDHLLEACGLGTSIERREFTSAFAQGVPYYDDVLALYRQHGGDLHTMEQMGADIAACASAGIGQALNNGLNDLENKELICCTDPQRIAQLVLMGLARH